MSIVKPVLGAVVGLQSVALLSRAAKVAKQPKKPVKPLKQSKRLIRGFTDIIIGTALLKPTANLVNTL